MTRPTSAPVADPWLDPETVQIRTIHLRPLVDWLAEGWWRQPPERVLDFGCGDLLLGRLLAGEVSGSASPGDENGAAAGSGPAVEVDGFDLSAEARDAARRACPAARVFDAIDEVPDRTYDVVVASSVLQYVADQEAVGQWLAAAAGWLRPGAIGVVVTDLPVHGAGRLHDGRDLAIHLARELGPLGAGREVLRSTRRSPGHLLRVDPDAVARGARAAGLVPRRLDRNLSPFTRRATFTFEVRGGGGS